MMMGTYVGPEALNPRSVSRPLQGMTKMAPKALVVYFSRTKNTGTIAEAVAKALRCDIEELVDTTSYKGIGGWLRAGKGAMKELNTRLQPLKADLMTYDLIIVGTPVWARKMSVPVRAFITQNKDRLKDVAFFQTMSGELEGNNAFPEMEQVLGKRPKATLAVMAADVKKGQYADKVAQFVAALRA